jgi:hypothetical protein
MGKIVGVAGVGKVVGRGKKVGEVGVAGKVRKGELPA